MQTAIFRACRGNTGRLETHHLRKEERCEAAQISVPIWSWWKLHSCINQHDSIQLSCLADWPWGRCLLSHEAKLKHKMTMMMMVIRGCHRQKSSTLKAQSPVSFSSFWSEFIKFIPSRRISARRIWGVLGTHTGGFYRWWKVGSTWRCRGQTPPPPEECCRGHYPQSSSQECRRKWHNLQTGNARSYSVQGKFWWLQSEWCKYLKVLLVTSGATLSMVTSRFPKSTGSLAIFSGLLGKQTHKHKAV